MNLKLGLALTAALLPAFVLAGEPPYPSLSIAVRYGDLDLSTPMGMRTLRRRLDNAAWQVCQEMLSQPVSIEGSRCRRELVAAALKDINRIRLANGSPVLR